MTSIISLIGPPGSGKGTYGALLASRLFNASFISVGDVLREQSATNEKLSTIMKTGELVDDGIVNEAVIHGLKNRSDKNVILLDGYPRNKAQTQLLQTWHHELQPSFALQIHLPGALCTQKILGRRKCLKCNKSFNVNGIDAGPYQMPPLLPEEGSCDVECNPDIDWEKREDDTEEIIKKRFDVYTSLTKPVLRYWRDEKKLIRFVPYKGIADFDKLLKLVQQRLSSEQ